MLVDRLDQNLPAAHPMAEVALRSILPPMEVGMAILTFARHIREYPVDMAFLAANVEVKAAQRIPGLAVIEIRLRPNRFPGRGGMTLLASNLHRAMRGLRSRGLRISSNLSRYTGAQLEQQESLD